VFGAQFTKFIAVLAAPIFNVHIACPTNHSGIIIQNLLQAVESAVAAAVESAAAAAASDAAAVVVLAARLSA
jgi:hypothetical protein